MRDFLSFLGKKKVILLGVFFFVFLVKVSFVAAQENPETQNNQSTQNPLLMLLSPTPRPCGGSGCPDVDPAFGLNYECAVSYEDWRSSPEKNFWVEDQEVTILGKNAERARQFVYWVLDRDNIYYHSGLVAAWSHARNVAFALAVLIVAAAGFLIIISEKVYTPFKIEVRNVILKTVGVLLFILFSFTITTSAIQVSDILMKFFIENMDVRSLFNIFFTQVVPNPLEHSETAYKEFIGCKNLSTAAQESVSTSMFLVNITNLTYYIIGITFLLREIVLWFLIIVSPFLPLLLYFRLIKNTGLIWIGVFFQWVFYGPLFALFLGAVSLIWNKGIPFVFNFSRVDSASGFVYPTAINILYGGPAQKLTFANTSSYVDTFAEYIISLLMLWTAIILPWWLLRIFRDYCCEGIYALKNLAMSFYEKFAAGKPPSPPTPPVRPQPSTVTSVQMPQVTKEKVSSVIKIKNIQEIKQLQTEKILERMDIRVKSLRDIALYETNKVKQQEVQRVIETLKQPERVATPEERQKVIALKTELYQRAKQNDRLAQRLLQVTSRSIFEQQKVKQELIKEKPVVVSVSATASQQVNLPQPRVENIFNSFVNNLTRSREIVSHISQVVQVPEEKAVQALSVVSQQVNQPVTALTQIVQKASDLPAEKVKEVFHTITQLVESSKVITEVSKEREVPVERVKEVLKEVQRSIVSEKEVGLPLQNLEIVHEINKQVLSNETILTQLEQVSTLKKEQIVSVVKEFNTAIESKNVERIKEIVQDKEKREVLEKVYSSLLSSKEVFEKTVQSITEVLREKSIAIEKVKEMLIEVQHSLASPEKGLTLPLQSFEIVHEVNKRILTNESLLTQLEKTSTLKKEQIVSVVEEFNTAIESKDTEKIREVLQNREKREVLETVYTSLIKANEVVEKTAQESGVAPEKIEEVVSSSLPVVAEPEKEVEKIIAPPETLSIEEYENTKQLWKDHYLKGEIPVSENIANREEWVERDIVILTNTLNKLLSDDPKLKEEGLDDVSYIIPLFLLNDMSLDDILVYLKAKLAAAKEVKEQLEREKKIREELEQKMKEKEELVEVKSSVAKGEEEKKYLQQEIPEEEPGMETTGEEGLEEEPEQEESAESETEEPAQEDQEDETELLEESQEAEKEEDQQSQPNPQKDDLSPEAKEILDKIRSKLPDEEKTS